MTPLGRGKWQPTPETGRGRPNEFDGERGWQGGTWCSCTDRSARETGVWEHMRARLTSPVQHWTDRCSLLLVPAVQPQMEVVVRTTRVASVTSVEGRNKQAHRTWPSDINLSIWFVYSECLRRMFPQLCIYNDQHWIQQQWNPLIVG